MHTDYFLVTKGLISKGFSEIKAIIPIWRLVKQGKI